ncbi:MAG: hypothetical protein LQ348_001370 [Seirophora lacunosa]|nr:MAG: hypothetical protein LQ348_001370 [Seirophora lacunosa]
MLLLILITLLTAILALHLVPGLPQLWRKRCGKPDSHRFSDPETCIKIIKGEPFHDSLGINQLTLEESRATPNERLVRAFQIDNGFTTYEPAYGRQFKKTATEKLHDITHEGWSKIDEVIQDFASMYFEKYESQNHGRLDLMVEVVTLKVILSVFLDVDRDAMSDEVVTRIAENINHLWIQSKANSGSLSDDFRALKTDLKDVGLDWTDNKENPLNILLPAYETLWRVVAHCLVEVVFRPSANAEWLPLLEAFKANPCSENFSKPQPGQDRVSVLFLIKEALRLYPPTRRIYRKVHFASKKEPEVVAADVEACHRLPQVWGEESHRYRPARWASANKSMYRAFMPFGGSPWICPASSSFGPMMIGVLVAAFASIISAGEWELRVRGQDTNGSSQVLDDQTVLDSSRRENAAWEIVRRSGEKS